MSCRYLSLCSGIEAVSQAVAPLGWTPVAFAETDPFCAALLRHYHPDVPNLGDLREIRDEDIAALGPIDVVVGGTPCQDLSVAGLRAGLAGNRSALFFDLVRIFDAARRLCNARWCWWENVPGALSVNQGRDFACVVNALAGCRLAPPADGWRREGVALGDAGLLEWAVLDARWFGLAQRRPRLFAVLDTGDWFDRAPVLLEPDSVRGDPPARGRARQGAAGRAHRGLDDDGVAAPLTASVKGSGAIAGNSAGITNAVLANPLTARMGKGINTTLDEGQTAIIVDACFDETQVTSPENRSSCRGDRTEALTTKSRPPAIAFTERRRPDGRKVECQDEIAYGLTNPGAGGRPSERQIMAGQRVRRLTPRECERLQGFPDDFTRIRYRGAPAKDAPRYRALGNSMAVPVVRWIAERLEAAHGPR